MKSEQNTNTRSIVEVDPASGYSELAKNSLVLNLALFSELSKQADEYLNRAIGPATLDCWAVWGVTDTVEREYPQATVIAGFGQRVHRNMFKLWCELHGVEVCWASP